MWILLAVLLILIILLFCPVTGTLKYDKTCMATVSYLFFKYQLLPPKPKKEKKEKKKQKKPKEPTEEKPKKKLSIEGLLQILSLVNMALKSSKKPIKIIFRHLTVKNIKLYVLVSCEDACQTAVRYGQVNAVVYSTLAAVKNGVKIKKTTIDIRPDFTEAQEEIKAQGQISLAPAFVIQAAVVFGFSFLKEFIKEKKTEKRNKEALNQG